MEVMQITQISSYNVNKYRNNKINSVNFKSSKEDLVSPKVMNLMKASIRNVLFCYQLNDVNKYVTPDVQQRIMSYPAGTELNIVKVPSKQLSELLDTNRNGFKLSFLEGLCVILADNKDAEKCNRIFETTVCLVPDPNPNPNLSELIQ